MDEPVESRVPPPPPEMFGSFREFGDLPPGGPEPRPGSRIAFKIARFLAFASGVFLGIGSLVSQDGYMGHALVVALLFPATLAVVGAGIVPNVISLREDASPLPRQGLTWSLVALGLLAILWIVVLLQPASSG